MFKLPRLGQQNLIPQQVFEKKMTSDAYRGYPPILEIWRRSVGNPGVTLETDGNGALFDLSRSGIL